MPRKLFFMLTIFLYITPALWSGDFNLGKYGAEFMSTGLGARALGMGGAYVAVAKDVATAYWNPAGLANLMYPQIIGMHSQRFDRIINYNYLGIAVPIRDNAALALSGTRLGADDIPFPVLPNELREIDESNRPFVDHYFGAAQYAFYLSYARQKNSNFYYGSNIKLIYHKIGDNSAWGIGFDFGVLWNPVHRLRLGANLQDGTSTLVAWDTGYRELITPTLKTGIAYPIPIPFLRGTMLPALDVDWRFEGRRFASQANWGDLSLDFHFGLEYSVKNVVALRIGNDIGHFTVGAGFRLPKLNIDYAFLAHNDLGETHRISVQLNLEEEKFKRHHN